MIKNCFLNEQAHFTLQNRYSMRSFNRENQFHPSVRRKRLRATKNLALFIAFSIVFFQFPHRGLAQTDANLPIHGITIYIDYPDVPASVTPVRLDSLINGITYTETGVQRSFWKYWHEQSRRNIDIHQDVFFYTAPLPKTHYDTVTWQAGILLWKDALEWVITNNPAYNWNALSRDANGGLRSVMIISSAWGPAGVGATHFPNWTLSNGVSIRTIYGSVLQAPWDTNTNMFMTFHESGHALFGFPDTYDNGYDSGGTSFYCLMSGGKPDVEPIGGPFQVKSNWGHILEPFVGTQTITLRADGDSLVVLRNLHDSLEFFTIEARKQSTMGNSLFPANLGLLIWHSDTKVNTSNNLQDRTPMRHYGHSIEQADGLYQLEGNTTGGNIGDIYLPGNTFNNSSVPSTKWWDDSTSGIEVSNIQLIGSDRISFTVTVPTPHADHYAEIPQSGWSLVSATNSQSGFDGTKAFDGDANTYYHVPWGNTLPRPHEIVIDLGQNYTINEFFYTANKNNLPPWEGRIEDYKLYISPDTMNWGTAVASRTFFQTGIRQYVRFAATTGRYMKFSATTSFNNDVRTSIAELNLRGFDPGLVSVSEPRTGEDYVLYPNPAENWLTIESRNHQQTTVEIFDLDGRLMLTQTMFQSTTINLADFSSAIYIVRMNSSTASRVVRIVKI